MHLSLSVIAQIALLGGVAVLCAPTNHHAEPHHGSGGRKSSLHPPYPPRVPSSVPPRYPPLPGPRFPAPLDHSVEAAMAALGKPLDSLRKPGTRPFPELPAGTETMPGIKHFVFLMMENHSYDNMMGTLRRPEADGFGYERDGRPLGSNPGSNDTTQLWFETRTTCQTEDMVSQEWTDSHNGFHNGSMDGFDVNPQDGTTASASGSFAVSYFTPREMPAWFALMEQAPVADRWFCSALAQTWPNRQYSLAGTSRGVTATGQDETGIEWPAGTVFDLLTEHDVSWKVAWNATENTTGNTLAIFNGAVSNETIAEKVKSYDEFFAAAASGDLPQFYYLDQRGSATTQEPGKNMALGESLIYDVVKALMEGPAWESTLFLINYDEHGGFADHVPPPAALAPDDVEPIARPGELQYEGFRRMGFRVPAAVMSPYGRRDFVSHTVYDHTSMLAFMQRKWNLPALTMRDANANSFEDMLDWAAMTRGRMTFPSWRDLEIPLPLLRVPGNNALDCSDISLTPPPDSVIPAKHW